MKVCLYHPKQIRSNNLLINGFSNDLYVLLFGQGRRFYPKWSEVSMISNKNKVGSDLSLHLYVSISYGFRGVEMTSIYFLRGNNSVSFGVFLTQGQLEPTFNKQLNKV